MSLFCGRNIIEGIRCRTMSNETDTGGGGSVSLTELVVGLVSEFPNTVTSIAVVVGFCICSLCCIVNCSYRLICKRDEVHADAESLTDKFLAKMDTDGDKQLDVHEIQALIKKVYKVDMHLPQVKVLVDRYDKDGDRQFTYKEFRSMMEDLEDQDDYDGDEGDIRDILRNIQAPRETYKREVREAMERRRASKTKVRPI